MKKLFLHIVIVTGLFFVMDRSAGIVLQYLYRQSNATDAYKISYSNEETRDSLLFFGSSRCLHHFVPSIFENELGFSCYNAADWGIKNIYFHYGQLGNILQRYTPQVIVFEIHPCDWMNTPFSGTERAGSLAPYCGKSEICDEMLKKTGKYLPYRLSVVYRYTGNLPDLLAGKMGGMNRKLKGWKPMDGILDTTGVKSEEYPFEVDSDRVALLESFIETCQQKKIHLLLTVSPMYVCSKQDVFAFPRKMAEKHNIPFIDHYRDSAYVGHPELFFDFGHLNRQGAEKYSKQFCEELKSYL